MKPKDMVLTIALMAVVAGMLPATAQERNLRAITPVNSATVDPFVDLNSAARDKNLTWEEFNDSLAAEIADCPPCSNDIPEMIQRARELSNEALGGRSEYLKRWRDLAQQDTSRFKRLLGDRISLRREIEMTLTSAEQQLADLQERNNQLMGSAEAQGIPAGNAGASLAALIQNAQERADTLREAMERWDEAQKWTKGSQEHAQAVLETVRQMHELVSAESTLWQAFYDGMERRAEFNCWKARSGQGPEPRPIYRPIKKQF